MEMKVFKRTVTREGMEEFPEWREGYCFVASEISDVTVCERKGKEKIGRIHLAESVVEITNEDLAFRRMTETFVKSCYTKFPNTLKTLYESEKSS